MLNSGADGKWVCRVAQWGEQSPRAKRTCKSRRVSKSEERCHGANNCAANPTNYSMHTSSTLVRVPISVLAVLRSKHSVTMIPYLIGRVLHSSIWKVFIYALDVARTWYNVSDECMHARLSSVHVCSLSHSKSVVWGDGF